CSPRGPRAGRPASPRRWPAPSAAGSSRGRPGRGWTGPTGPTRSWPTTCSRRTASGPRARPCSASARGSASAPTGPPTATCAATRPSRGRPRKTSQVLKKAQAGELVLLSQDEARFPMVPTLAATLGVKGHRPLVGTRDCKDLLYVFAVMNLLSGAVHANTLGSPRGQRRKGREGKTRRLQRAFARHLRHVGRMSPRERFKRVVLTVDNAPWHRGQPIDEALAENPHLEFYRLPSYSPSLNVIERFWKRLRRRATHNRLFDTIADLKGSVRASLRYFQTARQRVLTLINGRPKKPPK